MNPNFSDIYLLQHLENIASQLGIEVRYENLSDEEFSVHSGGCKLSGRNLIIIDTRHPTQERAKILGRELSGYDLEDLGPDRHEKKIRRNSAGRSPQCGINL